jgi:hypothetical protein
MLRASFGAWPRVEIPVGPIDHLRWKLSCPPDALALHRLTEVDGKAASFVVCWTQLTKVGAQVVRSLQGTDRVVHPAFQQRGLAAAIGRWRSEHRHDQSTDIMFGVASGHPAMQRLDKRATTEAQAFANPVFVYSLAGAGTSRSLPALSGAAAVRAIDRFDSRVDDLWQAVSDTFDFVLERRREYMNWRYADSRAGRFKIWVVEAGEDLLGYAVAGLSSGQACLADVLARPGRLETVTALVGTATAWSREEGALRIDWWLPERHPYQDVRRRLGFVSRRERVLTVRNYNQGLDLAFMRDPAARIHVAAGDTDLV